MNIYGSSLLFDHPQGPTGAWWSMDMIEALALRGSDREGAGVDD
jgi:hypothetical protein